MTARTAAGPSAPAAATEPHDAATLFRAHAVAVGRLLFRLGIKAADIDDLVQEVFVVAHRAGGYTPGPAKPSTWLAKISVRVASSYRRKRARWARLETGLAGRALSDRPPANPEQEFEGRRALQQMQLAIDAMSEEQQVAFVLFEIEREPCETIAALLEVPIGTVYSRVHAARKRLTQSLSAASADKRGGHG